MKQKQAIGYGLGVALALSGASCWSLGGALVNIYVAASYGGRRGIVRITQQFEAEVVLSGSGLVGLALQPSGRAILATTGALFTLDWDVRGLPLIG